MDYPIVDGIRPDSYYNNVEYRIWSHGHSYSVGITALSSDLSLSHSRFGPVSDGSERQELISPLYSVRTSFVAIEWGEELHHLCEQWSDLTSCHYCVSLWASIFVILKALWDPVAFPIKSPSQNLTMERESKYIQVSSKDLDSSNQWSSDSDM